MSSHKSMRILLLGPYPPPQGGIQTHLVALQEHLRCHAIPSSVINLTRFRKEGIDGVYYPHTWVQVIGLLLRLPYDIAHLHIGGNLSARLLALAVVVSSLPGKRTVLTLHSGGYPSSDRGRNTGPLTPRAIILRRFDGLVGVNREIVSFYRRCGASETAIRLIPPYAPVSIPEGTALPSDLDQFFLSHDPVLLSVGLLEREYDLPLQILTIEHIRKQFPRAGLVMIGSGSLEQYLKGLAKKSPERDHILLCGDLPHEATLLAIRQCSLLLRTTLYDGDALSVREALQLGTPVIATDNRMRPEGVTLIPPSDPEALRTKVVNCLKDAKQPPSPKLAGSENMNAIVELYEDVLAQGRRWQAQDESPTV
jgi:glycogen synthase